MCIQTSARLFLLLVAATAICSYGSPTTNPSAGDEIESTICTSNSDCDYVHGVCFKFDQCDKGRCRCDVGYELDYYDSYAFCTKVKKNGERCFGFFDTCELGSECGSDWVCVPKNTTITTENIFTTGHYDEPCIDSHNCWGSQKCLSGKCGCTSDKQRIKVYNDTAYYRKYIDPITDSCIDKNVELTLKKNDACSTDKLTDKYCGQLMPCGRCPEWSTTDNARCLSRSPTTNPSADVTGAPYQPCTNNSDCDYDGGVCWKSDSCELGTCYCDFDFYLSLRRRACAKPIKIGESCVPHDECIGRTTCKNNSCSCEDHGSTPSDDKTQCFRQHGETCSSRSDCMYGMQCLNSRCACGDDKIYFISTFFGVSYGRCMSKTITPKKKNEICDIGEHACFFNNLTCTICPESPGIYKCLSYNFTSRTPTITKTTTANFTTATTPDYSGANQVSMIALAVGCLFVFATLVVTLY